MRLQVVNKKKRKNNCYGFAAATWSLGCTVLEMLTQRHPYFKLEPVCMNLIYIQHPFVLCFLLFHFSFLVNFQDIKLWKLISFASEFAKSHHFKSGWRPLVIVHSSVWSSTRKQPAPNSILTIKTLKTKIC